MDQMRKERNKGAAFLVGILILALVAVLLVFPPWQVATDAPQKTQHSGMAQLPLVLWVIGAGILGLTIVYGIVRSRKRTTAEQRLTERATEDLYRHEEARRQRTGSE
jgi:uncharacterized integral membrane protein